MQKSITQQAIAQTSKELASRLLADGFRRQGVHLNRKMGDFFHSVHFQASQWGTAAAGQFTINLYVSSPVMYEEWFGKPFPANPASAQFPVNERIGWLLPDLCDYWWKVDEKTDIPALAVEVAEMATPAIRKFFSDYERNEATLTMLRQGRYPKLGEYIGHVVHMLVAHSRGYREEAEAAGKKAVSGNEKNSAFSQRVFSLARRLGLDLSAE